ncbi:hypothetical protein Pyn_21954 [Prunus yedoensis var. nudiflora]|uniref:RING-type domain-containing protein n=1 Tax=Prunus yedoensis var. nudiflora TaxID=2094558 RepID=A0A314ZDS9_PRUYE|nr:hypothetical protein Pyn_21954 [Prunus yedoensis var. nudiflora]
MLPSSYSTSSLPPHPPPSPYPNNALGILLVLLGIFLINEIINSTSYFVGLASLIPIGILAVFMIVVSLFLAIVDPFRRKASEMLLPPPTIYRSREFITRRRSCQQQCVICMEDFVDGDCCRVLPTCNHTFHLMCIDPWLTSQLTCPICRNPISTAYDLC